MDAMNLDPKVGTGSDVNAQEEQKDDAGGVETKGAAAPYLILEDDCEVRAVATFVCKEKVTDYLNHPKMLADTISAARNHGVILSKVMHGDGTVCAMPMVMLPTIAPEGWDKTMHEVSFDLAGCWSGVVLSGLWSKDLDLSRFVLELLAVIKVENATNGAPDLPGLGPGEARPEGLQELHAGRVHRHRGRDEEDGGPAAALRLQEAQVDPAWGSLGPRRWIAHRGGHVPRAVARL